MENKAQILLQNTPYNSMSYEAYIELLYDLLSQNKTTGQNHSDKMITYTHLNIQRMKKWDKITRIQPHIKAAIEGIDNPQQWIILSEGWCGDAAQSLPVINKLAAINQKITLRILLRDEHPEIMDDFLTNGARAIPKLIIMDNLGSIKGIWGPRPVPAQRIFTNYKNGVLSYDQYQHDLYKWYAQDKTITIQNELYTIIKQFINNELIIS